jgi:DNA polymerase-3 subunit delta'
MLIWMVEKLNHQAAPRLLKILEEPPDKTVFLIIAEQTDQIISTILSRLHLVKIPKIADEALYLACKQKLGLDDEKAKQLVRLSNGSFKQALIIQHQTENIEKDFARFVQWMRMCYTPDVKAIMDFSAAQGKENRQQAMRFLQFGMEILRNCLMIHLGQANLVRILDSQQNFYSKFAPFIHTANISMFAEEFDKAIHDIDRNVNGGIVMLDLSLRISLLLRMKEEVSA